MHGRATTAVPGHQQIESCAIPQGNNRHCNRQICSFAVFMTGQFTERAFRYAHNFWSAGERQPPPHPSGISLWFLFLVARGLGVDARTRKMLGYGDRGSVQVATSAGAVALINITGGPDMAVTSHSGLIEMLAESRELSGAYSLSAPLGPVVISEQRIRAPFQFPRDVMLQLFPNTSLWYQPPPILSLFSFQLHRATAK